MPRIVGVIFHKGGRIYDFDAGALELTRGDQVVVETSRGLEIGEVAAGPLELEDAEQSQTLKQVLRRAGSQDLETVAANREVRKEALTTCRELIAKHGLDMKLVDAEVMFGGGKIVFSFYSEERVDFRSLVVDLARELRMRIELRQIGVRDEARMLGGLGPCGRPLCCTLFQVDQEPVSIRMAKEQNLPLNPMKISGLCGRLMCCLKYEQEQYVAFRKEAPKRGTVVRTSHGDGLVAGYQVPKDALVVKLSDGTTVEEKARQVQVLDGEGHCIGTAISIDPQGAVTEVPAGEVGPAGPACGAGWSGEPGGTLQTCPGCPMMAAAAAAAEAEAEAGAESGSAEMPQAGQGPAPGPRRAEARGRSAGEPGRREAARRQGRGQVPARTEPAADAPEKRAGGSAGAAGDQGEGAAHDGLDERASEEDTSGGEATGEAGARKRRPRRRRRRPRTSGGADGAENGAESDAGGAGEPPSSE